MSANEEVVALGEIALLVVAPPGEPIRLDESAAAAERALFAEGESANTVRAYRSALRYVAAWFELRYGRPITLPVDEAAVVQFVLVCRDGAVIQWRDRQPDLLQRQKLGLEQL